MEKPLGRLQPTDWKHVEKYPFSALVEATPLVVEKTLDTHIRWREYYDQGREGACVGFGSSHMMSILNRQRYDAKWLWNEAKIIDEWPSTNPGDDNGTSVRAGMEVLRIQGHKLVRGKKTYNPDVRFGIEVYRWTGKNPVDEMRTAISMGLPVTIGVDWYSNFDKPEKQSNGEWWIGKGNLGYIRGGHCVCVYGASDRRQGFKIVNSWGLSYPLVYMPYKTMEQLILRQWGEAAIITDR